MLRKGTGRNVKMMKRRDLLKSGGFLCIGFSLTPFIDIDPFGSRTAAAQGSRMSVDAWLKISANRTVQVLTGRAELGQGIHTALGQIVAEELDVSMSSISVQTVDTGSSPDEGYTYSSISVQVGGARLRSAAGYARKLLLDMAVDRLGYPSSRLRVKNGRILFDQSETDYDIWNLLDGRQLTAEIRDASPKSASAYTIVGREVPRVDIPGKVFANGVFIQDMQFDRPLHARIVRPPSVNARLLHLDQSVLTEIAGDIRLVRDGSFLAVLSRDEFQVINAARRIADRCQWSDTENGGPESDIRRWLADAEADSELIYDTEPNAPKVGATHGATYWRPLHAHASISPSMAWAMMSGGQLTVWCHAQGMYPLRRAIATVTGLAETDVRCIHVQSSGVYGHNGADDAACDAALIALHVPETPVRLQYSRADEFQIEPYGSAMEIQVKATLETNGRMTHWESEVRSGPHSARPSGPDSAGFLQAARLKEDSMGFPKPSPIDLPNGGADRNAIPIYSIPSVRVTKHFVSHMPVRVSALRSLGAFAEVFAIESFVDEMARFNGRDPTEYRLEHLEDTRARAVLERLQSLCGRYESEPSEGRGIGFARYKNSSAYCAVAVYAVVDRRPANVAIRKVYAVIDAGLIVNPDGARNQVEGGIIQAMSRTLKEEVPMQGSLSVALDWTSYPILRFSEIPEIVIDILSDPTQPSLGVAEAAQGPTAAAIANSVAETAGLRVRDLPITAEKIETLQAVASSDEERY